jgi:DNA modification methylase
MGVLTQDINDRWAAYNGDCMEVMPALPDDSVHLSVYSPPFAGLYHYSSDERDLSNARSYEEFFAHYEFVVREIHRLTVPGRISAVRNRTLAKGLAHRTIVDDSTQSSVASADYLLAFRREGDNPLPVTHPTGLTEYAGERQPPADLLSYRGWTGKQTENRFSHWIWRQYASSFWDDVRLDRVLPFREARDEEDEKHVHPLQLDVIERALVLWSNPGERVLTPFMGVGSEVYEAVRLGRFGIGVELKPAYFRQALKNLAAIERDRYEPASLLDELAVAS